MNDFRLYRDDNSRYNSYEYYSDIYSVPNEEKNRSTMFLLISFFFMLIMASILLFKVLNFSSSETILKSYIPHNEQKDELSQVKLTHAISQSIIHHLQSNPAVKNLNDRDLKRIIKRVVQKIENEPKTLTYQVN